jgi:membrane-associated protease RseP (regulator of RpoE activity)
MKHFLRQYRSIGIAVLVGAGTGLVLAPPAARAQATQMVEVLDGISPLLLHSSSSQGYLGVDVADVDQEKAQALKLKEVRGAVITLIDHDAPAGKVPLKVNDVVIQLNGQNVEGAEQLRRMLKEIPAGRKVSLEISRDGNVQTVAVELADRRAMEHEVWNKIGNDGDVFAQAPGMGVMAGGGDGSLPGMFRMSIFGSTLNVGAMVEPLTSQMAEYLGVPSGLMVKQVAHKSEAATAGFKAFDVILKVGPDAVTTLADWDRALRANQGKPVQVTILRDKKQQTLTLQVDSKHKQGELEPEGLFGSGDCPVVAEIDPDAAQIFAQNEEAAARALRDQAQALKDKIGGMVQPEISSQQAEEWRKQAEELRDRLKTEQFQIDQKQMDELKQQMDEFRKNFKPEDLQNDPKQMDELKQQMEEFRKNFKPEDLQIDQKQMDELKQQMDELRKNFKPEDLQLAPN